MLTLDTLHLISNIAGKAGIHIVDCKSALIWHDLNCLAPSPPPPPPPSFPQITTYTPLWGQQV